MRIRSGRSTGVVLLAGLLLLTTPTAFAVPYGEPQVQVDPPPSIRKPPSQLASKPLPGCNQKGPNIGGVTRISATLRGSLLTLNWQAPQVRSGWSIEGYNIYAANPSTGIMEFQGVSSQLNTTIDFERFLTRPDGPVPIQIAAYGWYKGDSTRAEEGCRAGQVISGALKATNGQKITKRTWSKLSCLHLKDKAIIAVAGWYKGNARVVRPASFGAAILLSSAYRPLAGPIGNWLYEDFVSAVSDWSSEVIGPAEDFRVTTISCFSNK